MIIKLKVLLFKLANRLLNYSVGLELSSIGMTQDADRITMLIYTTPGLRAKALEAAAIIANPTSEILDCAETVH